MNSAIPSLTLSGEQSSLQDRLAVMKFYQHNPVKFCQLVLGIEPWNKQIQILNSVRDNPRTAVRSCTTAGKTEIASSAALWFLNCFYPSTVITTAPTFRQVRSIIWKRIRAQHNRSRIALGGDPLETELKLDDDWFALGLSTKEPDRLQGYHNINFLVIIDEAPG